MLEIIQESHGLFSAAIGKYGFSSGLIDDIIANGSHKKSSLIFGVKEVIITMLLDFVMVVG